MRTKFLKFGLPLAVFALAIIGAFASQKVDNKVLAPETGWINYPTPCNVSVSCRTEIGPVCTMFHLGQERQAYGKVNPNDLTCSKVLYKIP